MKQTLLAIILSLASLCYNSKLSAANDNDCAIVAAELSARLERAGVWHRYMFVKVHDNASNKLILHAMVVWQGGVNMPMLISDASGTIELIGCVKPELSEIITAFNKWLAPEYVCVSAHFLGEAPVDFPPPK